VLPACPDQHLVCSHLRAPPAYVIHSTPVASPEGQSGGIVVAGCAADPRGPWLRAEFCCLGPSWLTTTPSASLAGTRPLHESSSLIGPAFAVRERRGDPRDLPDFPWRAVRTCRRPYPGGSAGPSRSCWAQRYQAPSNYKRVATHIPVSASNPRRGSLSRLHRSRHAAARAFARPSWLAWTRRTAPPAEVPCHSRFWHWPSPGSAGSQAR